MVPDHDPLATGDTSGTTAGPGVDTQGTEATDDPGAPVVHQAPVFVLVSNTQLHRGGECLQCI